MKRRLASQPRLGGSAREPVGTTLPPHVNQALRDISVREGRSLSWVRAQIIYEYLGLDETGWFAKNERKRA